MIFNYRLTSCALQCALNIMEIEMALNVLAKDEGNCIGNYASSTTCKFKIENFKI